MGHLKVMAGANLSGRLEDNLFREIPSLKKKDVPHQLYWFLKEDYFSDELLGVQQSEIENLKRISSEAFDIFQRATEKILNDRELHLLGIPRFFEECVYHSWAKRESTFPFLLGRFDINGGLDQMLASVI